MNRVSAPGFLNEPTDYPQPVPFSRGISLQLSGARLVVLSGTASVGPKGESLHSGDFNAQARRMLENVSALLESAGATWQDVFKTTYYLKEMTHYQELVRIRAQFLGEQRISVLPASTCVQAVLCRPELLCEMEVLALTRERGG